MRSELTCSLRSLLSTARLVEYIHWYECSYAPGAARLNTDVLDHFCSCQEVLFEQRVEEYLIVVGQVSCGSKGLFIFVPSRDEVV